MANTKKLVALVIALGLGLLLFHSLGNSDTKKNANSPEPISSAPTETAKPSMDPEIEKQRDELSANQQDENKTEEQELYGYDAPATADSSQNAVEGQKPSDDNSTVEDRQFLYSDGYDYEMAQKECYQLLSKSSNMNASCKVIYDSDGNETGVEFKN